jgi:hypothetical protein
MTTTNDKASSLLMAVEQFCFGNKDSEKVFMHPLDMS